MKSAHDASTSLELAKPIYFFHMPKTGGRTVDRALISYFGRGRVHKPAKHKSPMTDILRTTKFVPDVRSAGTSGDLPHVSGHFASFSLIARHAEDYNKVCFWRDPAAWTLSLYNFRHWRNKDRLKRSFGFADFVRSQLPNPMTELFLLYCGDVPGAKYFAMSDLNKFEAAVALSQRFDRFADISQVDAFIDSIRPVGQERLPDSNRLTEETKVLRSLDAEMRAWVLRRSPVDALMHRISLGEDVEVVRAAARRELSRVSHLRDVPSLIAQPYYRAKVWTIPFI